MLVSSLKREYHSTEATLQEVTVRVLEGSTVAMRTLFPASLHDSGYASCRSARLSHLPRGLAAGKRIKPCPEISEAAVARPVWRTGQQEVVTWSNSKKDGAPFAHPVSCLLSRLCVL